MTFDELVASRKEWIADVLKLWCLSATRTELRIAEAQWTDLAGDVDPESTLYAWAWCRFPDLVHPESEAIDETFPIRVTLTGGETLDGFPDARSSTQGELVLRSDAGDELPAVSLDHIASVVRVTE